MANISSEISYYSIPGLPSKRVKNVSEIILTVCDYYDVKKEDIINHNRKQPSTFYRHVVQYMAKLLTRLSLGQIGEETGGFDHATVLHGIKNVNNMVDTDKTVKQDIENIKRRLG